MTHSVLCSFLFYFHFHRIDFSTETSCSLLVFTWIFLTIFQYWLRRNFFPFPRRRNRIFFSCFIQLILSFVVCDFCNLFLLMGFCKWDSAMWAISFTRQMFKFYRKTIFSKIIFEKPHEILFFRCMKHIFIPIIFSLFNCVVEMLKKSNIHHILCRRENQCILKKRKNLLVMDSIFNLLTKEWII